MLDLALDPPPEADASDKPLHRLASKNMGEEFRIEAELGQPTSADVTASSSQPSTEQIVDVPHCKFPLEEVLEHPGSSLVSILNLSQGR